MDIQIHTRIFLSADELELLAGASALLHSVYMDIPVGAPEDEIAGQAWEAVDAFIDICEHAEVAYENENAF